MAFSHAAQPAKNRSSCGADTLVRVVLLIDAKRKKLGNFPSVHEFSEFSQSTAADRSVRPTRAGLQLNCPGAPCKPSFGLRGDFPTQIRPEIECECSARKENGE